MIEPAGIPQFTGDFEQLEKDVSALRLDASGIGDAGENVHSRFQALGAYYSAPEADDLFATTEPVMSGAAAFAGKLEKVADALEAYSVEARPLAKKLAQLQQDAYTFVEDVDSDDEWTYDEDKVQRHQALLDGVAAAESAFRAAERSAATKISALVGGPKFVTDDGSHTVNDRTVMYGYDVDMLKGAEELPWGTPVEESHHAWELDHWGKTLVWDGIYKDNIEPAVTGLVDLATFDGDAWGGVRDVLTGVGLYTITPYDAFMDWAIGPDEESADEVRGKQAAKEFAKGLVAWDTWGENPVRASGTVVFNVLTLGTGAFARLAKGAEAGGTVAKGAGAAAKIGEYLDPLSAAVKVGGKTVDTIPRLSDVTSRITAGFGASTDSTRATSVLELDDGSKVRIENGEFIHVDRHGNVVSDVPPRERSAYEQRNPRQTSSHQRDSELVDVGARGSESSAAGGRNLPAQARHEAAASGDVPSRGSAAESQGPSSSDQRGRPSDPSGGTSHSDGRGFASDDGTMRRPGAGAGTGNTAHGSLGSGDPGGRNGLDLTPAERRKIDLEQAWKANNDIEWRKKHYDAIGRRLDTNGVDENGHELVKLTEDQNGKLIPADDLPSAPGEKYRLGAVRLSETTVEPRNIDELNRLANDRINSMKLNTAAKDFASNPSSDHARALKEAQEAFGVDRANNTKVGEKLGEGAARLHVMPREFPDATRIDDLPQTGNGANQFDDLYRRKNGNLIIVEEKAPNGELERRKGAGAAKGFQVKQGTLPYVETIVSEMEKRGPRDKQLAAELRRAMRRKTLEYVMVKATENTGEYAGATLKHFKLF